MMSGITKAGEPTRCPVAHGKQFDPLGAAEAKDPMPWLRQAQHEAPVFHLPEYGMWCVTRYDDVVEVLRDTKTYSSRKTISLDKLPAKLLAAFPDGPPDRVLVSLDPPEHTRLRHLAQRAFTPKLIEAREAETRDMCHALIDGFIDDKRCDIVSQFSSVLPAQVITALVGAPVERTESFQRWAADRIMLLSSAPSLPEAEQQAIAQRLLTFSAWLHEFVEDRRENPQQDLATALIQATTDDGEPVLSTSEIVNLIGTILSAGSSTTVNFIAIFMQLLLRHPDQVTLVRNDPSLMRRAVEEGLRRSTSVYGVPRVTTRPVTLGGINIPADATLYISYAAAQRDDSVFVDPDTFDIERENVHKHFAFGRGVHTCLGAPLARLETKVAAQALLDRLPNLRLAAGSDDVWAPHLLTPGPERVDVEWD